MPDKFSELLTAMLRSLAGIVEPDRLLGEFARRIEERHEEIGALARELGGGTSPEARLQLVLEAKKRFAHLAGLELLRVENGRALLTLGRRTFPLVATAAAPAATAPATPQGAPGVSIQSADDDVAARAQFLELD